MYKKIFINFSIIISLWSCVSEQNHCKPNNPALFVTQIHIAFVANNTNHLKNLMVDKEALIITLTEENKDTVYAYDTQLFTMATDDKTYKEYKEGLLKSYNTIKKKPLNWKKTSIQKATYQTDTLQISIKGLLVIRDDKNKIDSIFFNGIKLLDQWSLTKLY